MQGRIAIAAFVAVAALLSPFLLVSPARAEGPGVRLGDTMVFHPGISLGLGYDSNVFYAADDPNDPAKGAFYLTVQPSFDLATRPPQRAAGSPRTIDFRLHFGVPLRFLLSQDPAIYNHYAVGVETGAALTLFPMGHWTFDLFDNFVHSSDTPYSVVKAAFVNQFGGNINSDQNMLGMRLHWRPGGQRFETILGYTLSLYNFESSALQAKSNLVNGFNLHLNWNFFPKTAVYIDASEGIYTYFNPNLANTPPSAYPFRAVVGLVGLITAKLTVNLNIGYGNSFSQTNAAYPVNPAYSSVVGMVEGYWKPFTFTQFGIGYHHDFAQALIGTYYILDSAFVSIAQGVWKFTGTLRAGYERRNYQGITNNVDGISVTANGRVDNILSLHAQIDLPLKDYLMLSLTNDLGDNDDLIGKGMCMYAVAPGDPALSCAYFRDDVMLRLAFLY